MSDTLEHCHGWLRLTPDRIVAGLLVAECLLWMSDRLGWPAWHKGYAVLAVLAAVAIAILVMVLWWLLATLVLRRRFQFNLRSLLILTVVVALPLSWLGVETKKAKSQRDLLNEFGLSGTNYRYDFNIDGTNAPGPAWLQELVGKDFLADVVEIRAYLEDDAWLERLKDFSELRLLELEGKRLTDAGLQRLKWFPKLKSLSLRETRVRDAGLEQLREMNQLQSLDLTETKVTDAGVNRLRISLPRCDVQQWEEVKPNIPYDGTAFERVESFFETKGIGYQRVPYGVEEIEVRKGRAKEAIGLLHADENLRCYLIFTVDQRR